ncbi:MULTISPECIES: OsmC family peroxiredoxin [Sphingobacterium]|uniref:OsmC family peroxiredoxin n=1 Tax=Sphingobacterium TaxID=28453 RepID=UPI001047AD06|nr:MULTISPECIES: OsmC family peroxiredoxin [Sphingobacterium]MCW2263482.1 osmotically inducible protein OsmC [Sphingobacterium kitahiroshimense]TCR05916.1 osmotically inducible protein OsmC [Sphingobacterium sp. JUb78]
METSIKAIWQGSFKQGNGKLDIATSELNNVSFKPFFAKSDGSFTNPEELLASAHASCYGMALAYILSESGISADSLETSVSIVMENNVIKSSNLNLEAKIPDMDNDRFQQFAGKAKDMCTIGNALNVEINLKASLK